MHQTLLLMTSQVFLTTERFALPVKVGDVVDADLGGAYFSSKGNSRI